MIHKSSPFLFPLQKSPFQLTDAIFKLAIKKVRSSCIDVWKFTSFVVSGNWNLTPINCVINCLILRTYPFKPFWMGWVVKKSLLLPERQHREGLKRHWISRSLAPVAFHQFIFCDSKKKCIIHSVTAVRF